jgi:hypothetical protein
MIEKRIGFLNLLILFALVIGLGTSTQASGFDNHRGGEYFYNNFARIKAINFSDEEKILAVCQSTPKIPKGWVVVGQGNVEDCRNNSIAQPMFNAWFIKKPGKEEAVCQNSPLPDDYAVAEEVKIAACPGGSSLIQNKNGWIIRLIE